MNILKFRGSFRVFAAIFLASFAVVTPLFASPRQQFHGHIPRSVEGLSPVSRLEATNQLKLIIGLPLRQTDALHALLAQLYDPASTNFHQYLSPGQFAEQFGPTEADYQAAIAFAQSNHLEVTGLHSNRTMINVAGSVADIENAFQLHLLVYQHPTEARTFFAPDAEPSADTTVPLLSIIGLDNYILPHPMGLHASHPDGLSPRNGAGSGGTYLGYDFRNAYVPGTSLTGAGQTIALFESDGYTASDIAAYESAAGLPSVTLSNILIDSFSGAAGSDNAEVSLDIEMAIAMAPGISRILVYEGPNVNNVTDPYDILDRIATDDLAKQISCSWGFSINTNTEQVFLQYQTQGQSFFLASGDSGAYPGTVPQPDDDPFVTLVGATTLYTTGPDGPWSSEAVWNWYNTGTGTNASSGGISTTYSIPTWQQGVSMASNQGSTTHRNVPDVALTGDNIEVIYNGNGTIGDFGGTSCAAPLWAGFTALVNQQAALNGHTNVGFVNPAIYAIGLGTNYAAAFHDITTGNNTNPISPARFYAVTGFDLCTGWGTPAGTNLINLLAPLASAPVLSASLVLAAESCLPTNGVVDPGETVTLNLTIQNTSGVSTTNLVATLQTNSGLILPTTSQIYGAVSKNGGPVTAPFSFTANGACGGSITVVFQLQDGSNNLGNQTFTLPLGQTINSVTLAQNFDGVTAPALPGNWSTTNSGTQNWVTSTSAFDTSPNAAFCADSTSAGLSYLDSPVIPIVSTSAQLTFRQNYTFEFVTSRHSMTYYDGGILQIQIGSGAFTDIVTAGGSFVSNGYKSTLAKNSGNSLGGAAAWVGSSSGWITTVVNLPASAAGQNVQLRWVCGTDSGNDGTFAGWYVDSISLTDTYYSCCTANADLVLSQNVTPTNLVAGQPGSYLLTVSNAGPDFATAALVTDVLPTNVLFQSSSPGCLYSNGIVTCSLGTVLVGTSTNLTINFTTLSAGLLTNSATITSVTADFSPTDATNSQVTTVNPAFSPVPAYISTQPTNLSGFAGTNLSFQVTAGGTPPLSYQWFLGSSAVNGANSNSLVFTNVSASQAGLYNVVVTNLYGGATSSVVSLSVLGVPVSFGTNPGALNYSKGRFTVSISGFTGQGPVVIQSSTNLVSWTPVFTNPSGFGQFQFTNANAATNPAQYYRAVIPGNP